MPSLQCVAKEFAVQTTYEELCNAESREKLALIVLSDEGAWTGLDPGQAPLGYLIQETLSDTATAIERPFGPASRYRVVVDLLGGTTHGDRIIYAANRSETITDCPCSRVARGADGHELVSRIGVHAGLAGLVTPHFLRRWNAWRCEPYEGQAVEHGAAGREEHHARSGSG
ncbi:hypothetical protein [Streptomyces sp. NPDC051546]|uniref:hypothetical protein n=1 Tax=Streptomyces sp. NPDC051546 TaxID=3365655 RepID=UPI003798387A